jgi:cation:H+ antiporter
MTSPPRDRATASPGSARLALAGAALAPLPALAIRFGDAEVAHWIAAIIFGLAIVGAAFLLAWAAEVAQLDISAGLALALLALIAVLPEYAVDFVFAWKGGQVVKEFGPLCPAAEPGAESPCSLALANMTGANRLLIGVGWAAIVFIAWYRTRRRDRRAGAPTRRWDADVVELERTHSVELSFLAIATVYSLTLPMKSSITLIDSVLLIGVFAAYSIRIARAPAEEPHLVGPARYLGTFQDRPRRTTIVVMFLFSAAVIVLCAEPFAHALVETGLEYGISEFFLVQWLAPLASEAPEFIVAGLFAWRLNTNSALGALVSSKVNQWTLLVGTLPIVFAIASRSLSGLPIAGVQREEIFLTAAQSLFAVAVLVNLRMTLVEAGAIFGLFTIQFVASATAPESLHDEVLILTSIVYLVAGITLLVRQRRLLRGLLRDGFRAPYDQLALQR